MIIYFGEALRKIIFIDVTFHEQSVDLTELPTVFPYDKDWIRTGHPAFKFIMTVCFVFNDEIKPTGESDLIKKQRSELSFNEALKKAPTTHAYPLSSISGASGEICKPL